MSETVAGVPIPDSSLVVDATAVVAGTLVKGIASPLLFHHSRRVYLFGMLHAALRGLEPDPELLYVGAMFHDLGLTDTYRTQHRRFEIDGAAAAEDFLRSHGVAADPARRVWTAIALHTTPGVPEHMAPEIALVTAGVETDVLGIGYSDLDPAAVAEVIAAHPRPDFKNQILRAFDHGFRDRPDTTFGTVNTDVLAHFDPAFERTDFVDVIRGNPWPE